MQTNMHLNLGFKPLQENDVTATVDNYVLSALLVLIYIFTVLRRCVSGSSLQSGP